LDGAPRPLGPELLKTRTAVPWMLSVANKILRHGCGCDIYLAFGFVKCVSGLRKIV
jgi:hypothetical protein